MGPAEDAGHRVLSEVGDPVAPRSASGAWPGTTDEVREINQRLLLAGLRQQDLAAKAEQARQRLAFLLEASRILVEAHTTSAGLDGVAHLAVPFLADICLVDIALEEDRSVHQVFGDQQAVPDLAATVLRTGAAQLVSDLGDLPREAGAPDGHARERLRALGIRSYIVVPLRAGGRTLGALTFLAAKPRGSFGPEDLAVANNLACRCGLAIDNARLQQEVQRLARLDGVLLAARTMAHELNNQLTLTVSSAELLASDPALPSHLSELASEAQEGAHAAARTVGRLQRVAHLEEIDSGAGVGTILDLGRSTA